MKMNLFYLLYVVTVIMKCCVRSEMVDISTITVVSSGGNIPDARSCIVKSESNKVQIKKVTCNKCTDIGEVRYDNKVEGIRGEGIVLLIVHVMQNNKYVEVPFNVSCSSYPPAVQDSLKVIITNRNLNNILFIIKSNSAQYKKYNIIYFDNTDTLNKHFVTRNQSITIDNLTEKSQYQICVAGINSDGLSSYRYFCKISGTDFLVTGPVTNLEVVKYPRTTDEISVNWNKPNYYYDNPEGYMVTYRRKGGASSNCIGILIHLGVSTQMPRGNACRIEKTYNWKVITTLNIKNVNPYTEYNVTVFPINRNKRYESKSKLVRTAERKSGTVKNQLMIQLRKPKQPNGVDRSHKVEIYRMKRKTENSKSGPVENLNVIREGNRVKIQFDKPKQPNGIIRGYKVEIGRQITNNICKNFIFISNYHNTNNTVLYTAYTPCSDYGIAVYPINKFELGRAAYKKFIIETDPPKIRSVSAKFISKNLISVNWKWTVGACKINAGLIRVGKLGELTSCRAILMHSSKKRCFKLNEIIKRNDCGNKGSIDVKKLDVSTLKQNVIIGLWNYPTDPLNVSIAAITSDGKVTIKQTKLSLPEESHSTKLSNCFTDCFDGNVYNGIRSADEFGSPCTKWSDSSKYNKYRVKSNLCGSADNFPPWCPSLSNSNRKAYCIVPNCGSITKFIGCVRNIQVFSTPWSIAGNWSSPSEVSSKDLFGYLIMLHNNESKCMQYIVQTSKETSQLSITIRNFYVSCSKGNITRNTNYTFYFNDLVENTQYSIYVIPIINKENVGSVKNITIKTKLPEPISISNFNQALTNNGSQLLVTWELQNKDNEEAVLMFVVNVINSTNNCVASNVIIYSDVVRSNYNKSIAKMDYCDRTVKSTITIDSVALSTVFKFETKLTNYSLILYGYTRRGKQLVKQISITEESAVFSVSKPVTLIIILSVILLAVLIIIIIKMIIYRRNTKINCILNMRVKTSTKNENLYENIPYSKVKPEPILTTSLYNVEVHKFEEYMENATNDNNKLLKNQFKAIVQTINAEIETSNLIGNYVDQQNERAIIIPSQRKVQFAKTSSSVNSINAVWLSLPGENNDKYICSQNPTNSNVNEFWRLLWQQNVTCIIMLADGFSEDANATYKQYWPCDLNITQHWGYKNEYKVRLFEVKQQCYGTERKLLVENLLTNETRTIYQLQIQKYYDQSANSLKNFNELIGCVYNLLICTINWPLLVHFSDDADGIGCFVTAECIVRQLVKQAQYINIRDIVHCLKKSQPMILQNEKCYVFIHKYIGYYLKKYNRINDEDDIYDG